MGRTPDPMWAHTEEVRGEDNNVLNDKWKCKYCGQIYSGTATRVRNHVGKIKGKGIAACSSVPKEVVDSIHVSIASSEESAPTSSKRIKEMEVDSQGSGAGGTSSSVFMHVPITGAPKLPPVNPFKKNSLKVGLQKQAQPLYSVLRITDMEGCTLGLLYEYMDRVGECINKAKDLEEDEVDNLRDAWLKRWDWFHRPIHAMAHILHPLWRDDKQFENEELEEGWSTYIETFTGGDVQQIKQLEHERLLFRNSTGRSFSTATARLRECQLEPVSWWEKYGSSTPNLRRIAMRLLSQDCSSGPCERNWSTWSLFHTKRRNNLSVSQLERLVYCHCNLRLLEEKGSFIEPQQVNVDLIDIEKMNPIPEIPPEQQDIYAMLYEEASRPVRTTRGRPRVRVQIATTSTTARRSSRGATEATRAAATTSQRTVAEMEETGFSDAEGSNDSSTYDTEEEVSDEEIDSLSGASDT